MAKSTGLLDSVRSQVVNWWDMLDAAAQAELLDVRRQYRAGKLGQQKYKIAGAIISHASAAGWKLPTAMVRVRWLQKSDD